MSLAHMRHGLTAQAESVLKFPAARCLRPLASADSSRFQAAHSASEANQQRPQQDEHLIASVILERLPVVLPNLPDWEQEYKAFSFARQQMYRKEYPQQLLEKSSSFSAAEDEEGALAFEPASKITAADRKNDVRSLSRALDQRLFLIVQGRPLRSDFSEPRWHFPEREYSNEATMRQCAEKALTEKVGSEAELYFVGNAPCGHWQMRENPLVKRFFFRSQIIGSNFSIRPGGQLRDFAWVTKEELLSKYAVLPGDAEGDKDLFKKILI
eukprot:TRINITY_DN36282_c0_g1_i1.p1 TRINITY_DN36282_c0_g1~~TRINITY_DN36282_c0_g1_i1.p1  ORF type:complete len:269 (-),score=48.12 TRINITY_DN36282_c0_g1_i1:182-988(-)